MPVSWGQTLTPVCRLKVMAVGLLVGARLRCALHDPYRPPRVGARSHRRASRSQSGRTIVRWAAASRLPDGDADRRCVPRALGGHDRARPVHHRRSEFKNRSRGRHASARLRPRSCPGRSASKSPSENGALTFAVRIGRRRHPRGRPDRDAGRRRGRRACCGRAAEAEAQRREACSIPHTVPLACEARPHPERELDVGHGEVAASEAWRGRAWAPTERERGRPVRGSPYRPETPTATGTPTATAIAPPISGADEDHRRGDATCCPNHVRPRACRAARDERHQAHAARTPMSSAGRPSSVPASACREPSAAYVPCSD